VDDVYFDDEGWAVRYLVVSTGKWLPGRKVLISPATLERERDSEPSDGITVALTREQVENAPGIDQDPPISRTLEEAHARYFGYPYYWTGPYLWGPASLPLAPTWPEAAPDRTTLTASAEAQAAAEERARESHLRSSREVVGYAIRAADGEIGHVEDFLIDDEDWAIRDMIVDTRNWLPGKKVLVPPTAISNIDWNNQRVDVRLTRAELEEAPEAPA
jgi:hypothetical protein